MRILPAVTGGGATDVPCADAAAATVGLEACTACGAGAGAGGARIGGGGAWTGGACAGGTAGAGADTGLERSICCSCGGGAGEEELGRGELWRYTGTGDRGCLGGNAPEELPTRRGESAVAMGDAADIELARRGGDNGGATGTVERDTCAMRASRSDGPPPTTGNDGDVGDVGPASPESVPRPVLERLRGGGARAGARYTVPIGIVTGSFPQRETRGAGQD